MSGVGAGRCVGVRLMGHRRGVARLLRDLEAAGFAVSDAELYPVRGSVSDVRAYVTIFAQRDGYRAGEQP
jgi:hypothetical protein